MAIQFLCPICKTVHTAEDHLAGTKIECKKCGQRLQVPNPRRNKTILGEELPPENKTDSNSSTPPPLSMKRQERPDIELHHARAEFFRGTVVGFETIREQHIRGRGSLSGGSMLVGSYHGATAHQAATGGILGGGSVSGSQEIWTEYRNETNFFIRQKSGIDQPVRIGGDALQLLDGHRVTAVALKNDRRELMMCAVVNHSTDAIHWTTTERELGQFLGIPEERRVREELLSVEERDQQLREHNRRLFRYYPLLVATAGVGLILSLIGFILIFELAALGVLFLTLGVSAVVIVAIMWYLHHSRAQEIKRQPLSEALWIRNRELDEEIDRIIRLVRSLK